uniref:Homoserine dehydrogenase n=2 Tax=Desulfobacterium TaxID=2295 RepID=E1Y919_9BACT|nr:Homoserine dehydrogenase [uncultured Desulfobacterium sp.]
MAWFYYRGLLYRAGIDFMRKINIGLLGCGTVGTGVARILLEKKDLISSRIGAVLELKYVADLDTSLDRGIKFAEGVFVSDASKVVDDPEIDIIIELIGGEKIAKDLILRAIDNKKQIVTANKALLASSGNEIFKAAGVKGVDVAYEASVGGCMPVIKSIRESLIGNNISSMTGILNGTCNYILSKITDDGSTFEAALLEAQIKGFAEADPTLDIEGLDTAHKLAVINSIAYGMEINLKDIYIEGISKITPLDIEFAGQFGYRIKLLAISKHRGNFVEARVHPTMIPFRNMLSNVNGSLNAVTITGDDVGDILLYGKGAGMMPTASAIISDIADLARNILCGSVGRVPLLSCQMTNIRSIPILPVDEILTQYYFRFSSQDRPGVLSKISGILGKYGISLKSVHQKGRKTNGSVPIVMFTHLCREEDVRKAFDEISKLDVVSSKPALIRIEDDSEED